MSAGDTCIAETDAIGNLRAFYTPGVGFVAVNHARLQTGFWQTDLLGSTQAVTGGLGLRQSSTSTMPME